jgi:hypothetical protein
VVRRAYHAPVEHQDETFGRRHRGVRDGILSFDATVYLIGRGRGHVVDAGRVAEPRHSVAARGNGLRLQRGAIARRANTELSWDDATQVCLDADAVHDAHPGVRGEDREIPAIPPLIDRPYRLGLYGEERHRPRELAPRSARAAQRERSALRRQRDDVACPALCRDSAVAIDKSPGVSCREGGAGQNTQRDAEARGVDGVRQRRARRRR